MDDKEGLLEDLEQELRGEARRLDGATAAEITRAFTRVVIEVLGRHDLRPRLEWPIQYERGRGILNVAGFRRRSNAIQVAVEIDAEYRAQSAGKLASAVRCGAAAMWVRWGRGFHPWERRRVPLGVRHVEIRVSHRVRRRAVGGACYTCVP